MAARTHQALTQAYTQRNALRLHGVCTVYQQQTAANSAAHPLPSQRRLVARRQRTQARTPLLRFTEQIAQQAVHITQTCREPQRVPRSHYRRDLFHPD